MDPKQFAVWTQVVVFIVTILAFGHSLWWMKRLTKSCRVLILPLVFYFAEIIIYYGFILWEEYQFGTSALIFGIPNMGLFVSAVLRLQGIITMLFMVITIGIWHRSILERFGDVWDFPPSNKSSP